MKPKLLNAATFLLIAISILAYYGMVYFQLKAPFAHGMFLAGLVILFIGISSQKACIRNGKCAVRKIGIFSATLSGGLATFYLSGLDAGFGLAGPVLAASAVGLAGFEILQKLKLHELAAPLYCGAFIGMSSYSFFSFEMVAAAGLVSSAIYIFANGLYAGSGGKLGTIAFMGTTAIRKIAELLF